jgi:outer membrane protein assembly factor BamB
MATAEASTTQQTEPLSTKDRWTPIVRLALAAAATLSILPYTWGRVFIMTLLVGRPESKWLALLLVVVGLVQSLSYGLGRDPRIGRHTGKIGLALLIAWVGVNTVLALKFTETTVPPWIFLPLWNCATVAVFWFAWMWFFPIHAVRRFGMLTATAVLLAGFIGLVKVHALKGDSTLILGWRFAPERDLKLDESAESLAKADLAKTTPQDFAAFLGPKRDGILASATIDPDWKTKAPKQLWKHDVGAAWSAFAVVGDYAVTQEQRGEDECVVCYEIRTGKQVWIHRDRAKLEGSAGGTGPRATPTIHQGDVYTLGATGVLNRLDGATGKSRWSVNILKDAGATNPAHGMCGSPLIVDETVVVGPGGPNGYSLIAYNRETGKQVWHGGSGPASYSSPLLAEIDGQPTILYFNAAELAAHDPKSGKVLWTFPWKNDVNTNCAQPVVLGGKPTKVFLSSGYGAGAVLLEVAQPKPGEWKIRDLWTSRDMKNKFTTSIVYKDHLYGLDDGILACISLKDGRKAWKGGRYGHGQALLVGDVLLVQAEDGTVVLVEPDPKKLKEIAKLPALDGKTWNNPVLSGSLLLVRNDHEAICFETATKK